MPNTISSTWQFPSGSEYGNGLSQTAAEQYGMDTAPVAAELGVTTTPIREGNAPDMEVPDEPTPEVQAQYYTNTGDAVPTDRSAAVLDATRSVVDALDVQAAQQPTPEVPQDANHDRAAFERMRFYGPTLEAMRDGALRM